MSDATQQTFSGFEQAQVKQQRDSERKQLARDTRHVNDFLHEMGRVPQVSVPLDRVNDALRACGFDELDAMILCGREGRLHEFVGRNRWLVLTWYKYESGNYEVVAYVS